MGVRVEVAEGEPIAEAIKRWRNLIRAEGGFPIIYPKWHKRRYDCYCKPSIYRRRVRWVTKTRKRLRQPFGFRQ